jgi:hypothetical protein
MGIISTMDASLNGNRTYQRERSSMSILTPSVQLRSSSHMLGLVFGEGRCAVICLTRSRKLPRECEWLEQSGRDQGAT